MVLGIGLPMLIGALGTYVFFVESPRWLNSQGNFDECRKVLRFVSIYNRRKPFEFNFSEEMDKYNSKALRMFVPSENEANNIISSPNPPKATKSSYFDLCRHRKLTKITGILMLSWFLRYFTYYGIQFSIETFGTSL